MEWKNIKDELPPIGKKIILVNQLNTIKIATLSYEWILEEDFHKKYISRPAIHDEENIKAATKYWLLLPELPIEEII